MFARGKTVLNQKSELQKAMQKHRETQSRKEIEQERMTSRTALEITLAERARRLEEVWNTVLFYSPIVSGLYSSWLTTGAIHFFDNSIFKISQFHIFN